MSRTSRRIHGSARPAAKSEDLGLGVKLLFADDAIAILEKPAGLLSARMGDQVGDSVFDVIKAWAKVDGPASRNTGPKRGKDRDNRPAWIIHRLDREVSGVMVFALTNDAFLRLKDDLQVRRISRRYAAVVEGEIPKGKGGTVSGFLADQGAARPVKVIADGAVLGREADSAEIEDDALAEAGPAPKRAITHWKCVASGRGRSLLEITLETGRKHQIRAHMASLGHAIVGDALYGSKDKTLGRVGLHAVDLRLPHPRTGVEKAFQSPVPREFFIAVGEQVGAWPETAAKASPSTLAPGARGSALAAAGVKEIPAQAKDKPAAPAPSSAAAAALAKAEPRAPMGTVPDAGWDHVAPWYDDLLSRRKSDHHDNLVLPGVVRLLAPKSGERALDVACGEGTLARMLAAQGIATTGVDAAPQLIQRAQGTRPKAQAGIPLGETSFLVGDARKLGDTAGLEGPFDMASCVLALMNIDPLAPVLAGVAAQLKAGGRFVAVMLHPAFRSPGQTHWGEEGSPTGARNFRKPGMPTAALASEARAKEWEKARKTGETPPASVPFKMFRKVEGYLSPTHKGVVMNPGEAAKGAAPVETVTWHRPIQSYVAAFAKAGLLVDALEEWASLRQSESGPRAHEEDRIRREIPMFLALRGVKAMG